MACVCASVIVLGFKSRICIPISLLRFKRYRFTASCSSSLIFNRRSVGLICCARTAQLISFIICLNLSVKFWTDSVAPCLQLSSFNFKAKIEFDDFKFCLSASYKSSYEFICRYLIAFFCGASNFICHN